MSCSTAQKRLSQNVRPPSEGDSLGNDGGRRKTRQKRSACRRKHAVQICPKPCAIFMVCAPLGCIEKLGAEIRPRGGVSYHVTMLSCYIQCYSVLFSVMRYNLGCGVGQPTDSAVVAPPLLPKKARIEPPTRPDTHRGAELGKCPLRGKLLTTL